MTDSKGSYKSIERKSGVKGFVLALRLTVGNIAVGSRLSGVENPLERHALLSD